MVQINKIHGRHRVQKKSSSPNIMSVVHINGHPITIILLPKWFLCQWCLPSAHVKLQFPTFLKPKGGGLSNIVLEVTLHFLVYSIPACSVSCGFPPPSMIKLEAKQSTDIFSTLYVKVVRILIFCFLNLIPSSVLIRWSLMTENCVWKRVQIGRSSRSLMPTTDHWYPVWFYQLMLLWWSGNSIMV